MMSRLRRLDRGETTIGFVRHRRRWFIASAVVMLVALAALGIRGLNLGVDFRGGVAAVAANPAGAEVAEIRAAVGEAGVTDALVQLVDEGQSVRLQTGVLEEAVEADFIAAVAAVTGVEPEEVSVDAVGPTFGALVARQAATALAVFLGAVALYMAFRLELKMALAALAALVHDLIATVGVYALTGFEVTPATVVAILTILGYSLYDTVVVFDKIDELVKVDERLTYSAIVERAMNQVLVRSLATSLTSLLPVGSILVVGAFILGAPSLEDFALALFVGMGVGIYSSIFLAAPLLAVWKEREAGWQERHLPGPARRRSPRSAS